MNVHERAAQIWPLLSLAARNRQTFNYDMLGQLIGVPRAGLGQLLEPIQSYCLLHDLPALTSLVVSNETGLPGTGFIYCCARHPWYPRSRLQARLVGDTDTDARPIRTGRPKAGLERQDSTEPPEAAVMVKKSQIKVINRANNSVVIDSIRAAFKQ